MKYGLILAAAAIMAAAGTSAVAADVREGAEAYVVKCSEYISLREKPSGDAAVMASIPLGEGVTVLRDSGGDYVLVGWQGKNGYVLRSYLDGVREGNLLSLSGEMRYQVNLFLSNFTEAEFCLDGDFDVDDPSDRLMTDFAIRHLRLHAGELVNGTEGGEASISADYVSEVAEMYFGMAPEDPAASSCEYRDGAYYWDGTEEVRKAGFACLSEAYDLGDGICGVYFRSYGCGGSWNTDACRLGQEEASRSFFRNEGSLYAEIDISEDGSWKILRYIWR